MRTMRREAMATVRVPPGPRGNVVLGSIGDLYRDRLRFVLDVARTYGDVAQYRGAHMSWTLDEMRRPILRAVPCRRVCKQSTGSFSGPHRGGSAHE